MILQSLQKRYEELQKKQQEVSVQTQYSDKERMIMKESKSYPLVKKYCPDCQRIY